MAPIHHHFELLGWSETKIILRFWIVAAAFAAIGFTIYQNSIADAAASAVLSLVTDPPGGPMRLGTETAADPVRATGPLTP